MIAICKKETKRTVKGVRYDVLRVYSIGTGSNTRYRVRIKDAGTYSIDNFTDINGNPLAHQPFNTTSDKVERLVFESLSKGDILVCTSDRYKNLIKGKMYKISDLKTSSRDVRGWNGQIHTYVSKFIKLDGGNRYLKFNSFSFRSLSKEESRNLNLNSLLHGTEEVFTIDKNLRKIDSVENKDSELIKILSKSIIDSNRHHFDIIDWAYKKSAPNMGIERSDYDKFLNMSLREILEIVKQNK